MSIIYINPFQFAAAGPTDPYFANVSLLLHGDGTNGSTTIIDSSPSPKTVTAFGDAQITTAQSKFGGASIAFDGNGDYLTVPAADFDLPGSFTIELFARLNSLSATQTLVGKWSGGGQAWIFQIASPIELVLATGLNGTFRAVYRLPLSTPLSINAWHHIALSYDQALLRHFVNGVSFGSTSITGNLTSNATSLGIGLNLDGGQQPLNGYIDDLRITKNVARYTANFTPPTAPFPDA